MVILQLSSVYIVHNVLNRCKAETETWLYCSHILLYCVYCNEMVQKKTEIAFSAANFCLYCAYCFELVQIGD